MNENEIIMENFDMEVIPEKKGVNFGAIGLAVLATGAAVALGCKIVKAIKAKNAQKAEESEYVTVDENDDSEE